MLYRYFCDQCGKTYIGPMLPGTMTCNCAPPRQISGRVILTPLSDALTKDLSYSEAADLREKLCRGWNITNKSHPVHGANFSGNQKVVQLINNIVAPVATNDWARVRALVQRDYQYDIDTKEMTG